MDDRRHWGNSPNDSVMWMLGRLDAKSDQHREQLGNLHRALDHTILALQKSTQTHAQQSAGAVTAPASPPASLNTAGYLTGLIRHAAPDVLKWVLMRMLAILLKWALPLGLLIWAAAQKWIGVGLRFFFG